MSKLIFHIIPHGPGLNVGNFAISNSIKFMIKAIDPDINILTIDAMSQKLNSFSGLNKKTIYEANQYSNGIILGGGNLYENNELSLDVNSLDSLEVPLILFSLSIGRIYNNNLKLSRRSDVMPDAIIKILNKKSIISLSRDFATFNYLKKIGLNKNKLGLCPTIFLNEYFEIPRVYNNLGKGENLLVVRNPEQMSIPYIKRFEVADFIKKIYLKFKKEKKEIKILCNDIRDIAFVNSLGINSYVYTQDVNEYLTRIKMAELIMSFRIHASLPALSFQKKFINFSYDERGESLMKSIGFENWDVPIIKNNNLWELFINRLNSQKKFDLILNKSIKNIKKYKAIQLQALKKII